MLLCKILIHVRTVLIHKWYVGYYCFKAGLYKQGFLHDISKFSYTEFSESIKYANAKDNSANVLSNKKRLKALYKAAELEYLQRVQEGKERPDIFIRNNIRRNLL